MKSLSLAILLFGAFASAQAQQPAENTSPVPTPPPGPMVLNRAPEMAQWTISFSTSPGKDQNPSAPKPKADQSGVRELITKTNAIYHVQMVTGAGTQIDKWCLNDIQVTVMPNAALPVVSTPADKDQYYMDFSRSDFSLFHWVSRKNFVGMKNIGGSDCLVFEGHIPAPSIKGGAERRRVETVEAHAYIDFQTRMPLFLQTDDGLFSFQYGTAPTVMLTPPENIVGLTQQWHKRMQQAAAVPPS